MGKDSCELINLFRSRALSIFPRSHFYSMSHTTHIHTTPLHVTYHTFSIVCISLHLACALSWTRVVAARALSGLFFFHSFLYATLFSLFLVLYRRCVARTSSGSLILVRSLIRSLILVRSFACSDGSLQVPLEFSPAARCHVNALIVPLSSGRQDSGGGLLIF